VYGTPCAVGRTPEELNAERAAWIAEHAYDGELEWVIRGAELQAA
jgi:hypothetical protein